MGCVEEAKRAAFARLKLIMENCVIGFSGQIGSGKSTLSRAVAEELQWPCVSFGGCIRAIALSRGLELRREILQDLGAALVKSDPEKLCKLVLADANVELGQPFVIEGIRHVEILRILRGIVLPLELHLVFVTVAKGLRSERLRRRDRYYPSGISERHSTERDVESSLKSLSSCVIENNQSIDVATHLILAELESCCFMP